MPAESANTFSSLYLPPKCCFHERPGANQPLPILKLHYVHPIYLTIGTKWKKKTMIYQSQICRVLDDLWPTVSEEQTPVSEKITCRHKNNTNSNYEIFGIKSPININISRNFWDASKYATRDSDRNPLIFPDGNNVHRIVLQRCNSLLSYHNVYQWQKHRPKSEKHKSTVNSHR